MLYIPSERILLQNGCKLKLMSLILDLLFPKKCVGCRQTGSYFCAQCMANIGQLELVCPKCERPSIGGQTHPVCQRKYGLDGLWSFGVYQKPLKEAIQALKYRYVKELAESLSDIVLEYWVKYQPFLLDQIKKDQGTGWSVVPVPLHWYRQNWRGFNQSSLIGKQLSNKLGLEYRDCLTRQRYTTPQAKLKSFERHQNIKSVFSLNSEFIIHNSKILLVDDVWTTGSTLRECCFILKKHGAKKVWALTLAR